MKLAFPIVALALFTSSFDIFLVLNAGGTLRFAQGMLVLVLILALAQIGQTQRILWPRGGLALALWTLLQGIFLIQSQAAPRLGVQLYLLLLFTVISVFTMLQLFGRSNMLEALMKTYLYSFLFTAGFGAVQFVSPALHLGSPLIQQWIRHGLIPRINGFSYEPSYFATYLVMGWILLIDLRVTGARLTAGWRWHWSLIFLSCILFLCTSKTAWLLMLVEGIVRLVPTVWGVLKRQTRQLRTGLLLVPLPRVRPLIYLAAALAFLFSAGYVASRVVDLNSFLSGTGINNTAAHSLNDRVNGFRDTATVFQEHPWVGRSLAGVTADKAALHGERVTNIEELRLNWGFPVPMEVLAASGIVGFLPFLWFFVAITGGEARLMRDAWSDERAKWLHGLVRALVFEWLALLQDQNLIRVYFWFHVTMVVIVGYHLRYSRNIPFSSKGLVTA